MKDVALRRSFDSFCAPCLTRDRATAAMPGILSLLTSDDVELELRDQPHVSVSFLDEVVAVLAEHGKLDRVTFVLLSEGTSRKLAIVAGLHPHLCLYVKAEGQAIRYPITPSRLEKLPIETEPEKPSDSDA